MKTGLPHCIQWTKRETPEKALLHQLPHTTVTEKTSETPLAGAFLSNIRRNLKATKFHSTHADAGAFTATGWRC